MTRPLLIIALLFANPVSAAPNTPLAAVLSPPVIAWESMSSTWKETIVSSVVVAIWVGSFSQVWPMIAPELADETKPKVFIVLAAIGIGALLWLRCKFRGRRMSLLWYLCWGGGSGLAVGVIAYLLYGVGEMAVIASPETPSSAAPDGLVANPDTALANPAKAPELDLLVRNVGWSHSDTQVFLPILLTNRSGRDMALNFAFLVSNHDAFPKVNPEGKTWWQKFPGRWNGSRGDIHSGQSFVKVPSESAVDGHLVFDFPNPKIVGLEKWNFSGLRKDNLLEISDRISGKRIWCSVAIGYPPGIDDQPWVPIGSPADDLGAGPYSRNPEANPGNPPKGESNDIK